jgi:uncharacterized protein YciI
LPYLIETHDKPGHQSLRQPVGADHLQYLELNKNKLLASGAKLDDAGENASGGIYILDTDSRSDAEAFTKAELFRRIITNNQSAATNNHRWHATNYPMDMRQKMRVVDATYNLLRTLGLTTGEQNRDVSQP